MKDDKINEFEGTHSDILWTTFGLSLNVPKTLKSLSITTITGNLMFSTPKIGNRNFLPRPIEITDMLKLVLSSVNIFNTVEFS